MNSWRLSSVMCAGRGQDADGRGPLVLGQLDVARERVQVPDQALHDLAQAWIGPVPSKLASAAAVISAGEVVAPRVALSGHSLWPTHRWYDHVVASNGA